MPHSHKDLTKDKGFMALFVTHCLGTFHDNLFKNALVSFVLFNIAWSIGDNGALWVTIASGVYILPFVLCSCLGGAIGRQIQTKSGYLDR